MPEKKHDQDLTRRAAAGDLDAVELLLTHYHDRLLRTIERNLPASARQLACPEDVLQDTFCQVFKSLSSFTGASGGSGGSGGPGSSAGSGDAFYAWISTIAKRRIIDLTRRAAAQRRVRPGHGHHGLTIVGALAAQGPGPRSLAGNAEAVRAVRRALAALPEDYRRVLELRHIEGLAVAAVAAKMGRSVGAVQMLAGRAMERLREELGAASKFFSDG